MMTMKFSLSRRQLLPLILTAYGLMSSTAYADAPTYAIEKGAKTMRLGEKTYSSIQGEFGQSFSALGYSQFDYAGQPRIVQAIVGGECAATMSLNIVEIAAPGTAIDFNDYTSDVSSKSFPLKPVIEVSTALAEKVCATLQSVEIAIEWLDSDGLTQERRIVYASRDAGWAVQDRLSDSSCQLTQYTAPADLPGLIPTLSDCPHTALFVDNKPVALESDWTLQVTNLPLNYVMQPVDDSPGVLTIMPLLRDCPNVPVQMTLSLNAADFGGKDVAMDSVRVQLTKRNSAPLSRVFWNLLNRYNFCHEDTGFALPQFRVSVVDASKELGVISFEHMGKVVALDPNDASVGRSFFVDDQHPLLAARRRSEKTVETLSSSGAFSGYPAGLYLSAIAAGEFDVARELDRQAAEPYVAWFAGQDDYLRVIALMSGNAGRFEEFRASFLGLFSEFSLVSPLAATYVLSYDANYQACLGSDRVTVTVVEEWQDVLSDGYGFEISRGAVERFETDFSTKPELGEILRVVAGKSPKLLGVLDEHFRGGDTITAADISRGITQMMRSQSCDAPETLRFESNMREYWQAWSARTKKYTSRM